MSTDSTDRPVQIEVTQEMIEAGLVPLPCGRKIVITQEMVAAGLAVLERGGLLETIPYSADLEVAEVLVAGIHSLLVSQSTHRCDFSHESSSQPFALANLRQSE